MEFSITHSKTPNPASIAFRIQSDLQLKELLLSESWDSVNFSGGFLDTFNLNGRWIGVAETEKPDQVIIGIPTGKVSMFTQNQLDSITLINLDKVIINVYSGNMTWSLRNHASLFGNSKE